MVIYYTTRDKPVLGEIVKMGLCQMLTKGHSMHNGKKLLQLRVSGIHISSQPCKPPIFSVRTPLLIFSRSPSQKNYFCYNIILLLDELQFDFHYVITKCSSENLAVEIVETRTGRARAAAPPSHN